MKKLIEIMKRFSEFDFTMYYLNREENSGVVLTLLNNEVVSKPILVFDEEIENIDDNELEEKICKAFDNIGIKAKELNEQIKKENKKKIIQLNRNKIIN